MTRLAGRVQDHSRSRGQTTRRGTRAVSRLLAAGSDRRRCSSRLHDPAWSFQRSRRNPFRSRFRRNCIVRQDRETRACPSQDHEDRSLTFRSHPGGRRAASSLRLTPDRTSSPFCGSISRSSCALLAVGGPLQYHRQSARRITAPRQRLPSPTTAATVPTRRDHAPGCRTTGGPPCHPSSYVMYAARVVPRNTAPLQESGKTTVRFPASWAAE